MRTLSALCLSLLASVASCSGGMVFTAPINNVLPSHSSLSGTYWGWNFRTNLAGGGQVNYPVVQLISSGSVSQKYGMFFSTGTSFPFISPTNPGSAGYMTFDRHDTTIDFQLGSSIRAEISYFNGHAVVGEAPVPGMMMGLQDRYGRFYGVGFGYDGTNRLIRIINNPFTGSGTEWVPIPNTSSYYHDPATANDLTVELVIAGSRATVLVSGREMKNSGGSVLMQTVGTPLNSLIFTPWGTYGGAIIGDYSTTSAGMMMLSSLSYY